MVTKSLLDKILSKTVKRSELNALPLSKKDRDRIYDNILNSGKGESIDVNSLYDFYVIMFKNNNSNNITNSCFPIKNMNLPEESSVEAFNKIIIGETYMKNKAEEYITENYPDIYHQGTQFNQLVNEDNTQITKLLIFENINIRINIFSTTERKTVDKISIPITAKYFVDSDSFNKCKQFITLKDIDSLTNIKTGCYISTKKIIANCVTSAIEVKEINLDFDDILKENAIPIYFSGDNDSMMLFNYMIQAYKPE